jgi:hypothetical protein
MRVPFAVTFVFASLVLGTVAFGVEGTTSPYSDPAGDIDPGIANAGGTADILGMEVSNTLTDINFKLTVNGDVATTNWAKFMIGIASTKTAGTTTGNGWGRPINLQVTGTAGPGMDHWIGSWVDGGNGSQLWSYTGGTWSGPGALGGFSVTPGATSQISYTVSMASLGLVDGDTFYFDAYSSGGGGGDSAIDSLANPNVSITSWSQTYTSQPVAAAGLGLNSYTITAVPEPASVAAFGVVGVAVAGRLMRRRSRAA